MLSSLFSLGKAFSSNRSQRGLWHGKDIRTGYSYSFSHTATKRTFKPNIFEKRLWSEILQRYFFIEVSSYAYRLIRIRGGLDNYILSTRPKNLHSRFGEVLRTHMKKKLEDPEYTPPYIPHTKKIYPVSAKKKNRIQQSPVWLPIELRNKDLTEFELDAQKLLDLYGGEEEDAEIAAVQKKLHEEEDDVKEFNITDMVIKNKKELKAAKTAKAEAEYEMAVKAAMEAKEHKGVKAAKEAGDTEDAKAVKEPGDYETTKGAKKERNTEAIKAAKKQWGGSEGAKDAKTPK
mmetsp:Transcript_25599/g.44701  ORF Transcript_25599/g.44701 Transcript_25599/m.44701 type:complete len:289 (-) Transcript_25599:2688-3554(-)